MRTFISINPDKEAKKKIFEIQNDLKRNVSSINVELLNSIKWVTIDKFHLTLFFIGEADVNKVNAIHSGLKKLEAELSFNEINFTAKGINAFPKLRYPRVLILDLLNENNNVFELSHRINSALKNAGYESDKPFHPHITLGRIKRDCKINLTNLDIKTKIDLSFPVKNFYLMESKLNSKGSEYSVLKEYKI